MSPVSPKDPKEEEKDDKNDNLIWTEGIRVVGRRRKPEARSRSVVVVVPPPFDKKCHTNIIRLTKAWTTFGANARLPRGIETSPHSHSTD
jgi:hypothetical protein